MASITNTQNQQQLPSAVVEAALTPSSTTKPNKSAAKARCVDMQTKLHEAEMELLEIKTSNLLNVNRRKMEVLDAELEYWKNMTKAIKTNTRTTTKAKHQMEKI